MGLFGSNRSRVFLVSAFRNSRRKDKLDRVPTKLAPGAKTTPGDRVRQLVLERVTLALPRAPVGRLSPTVHLKGALS